MYKMCSYKNVIPFHVACSFRITTNFHLVNVHARIAALESLQGFIV